MQKNLIKFIRDYLSSLTSCSMFTFTTREQSRDIFVSVFIRTLLRNSFKIVFTSVLSLLVVKMSYHLIGGSTTLPELLNDIVE